MYMKERYNTMQQMNEKYNEISLRELIEVLLKGWRLIAIITVISLLFTGIFSFFIQEPVYEAKTILMATFATEKLANLQDNTKDIAGILDTIAAYPTMTMQTYKEQIKSSKILQQVINELDLGKYEINRSKLREMVELETIKDTNLIAVKVTHKDPLLAVEIANTLTKEFTESITDMTRQQASKSSLFLKGQLEVEKKNLDEATLELKEYLSQPRGANELRQEFDSKLLMLTTFKTQLVEKEVELNKANAGLKASEKELKNTPQLIVTNKSVGQDPLLNQIVAENNGTSIKDTAQITMRNEEINEGYISLSTKVSEYRIAASELSGEIDMIRIKINTTQIELENMQKELADKEHNQALIQRKVELSQGTYDTFLNKYEEIRIAESAEIGDSTINIVSQAAIPELPTGPSKVLNLAIAGIIGMMLGVFVAFLKVYWKTSGQQQTVSK
jgi:polysaccharide biosynthesis transport protein